MNYYYDLTLNFDMEHLWEFYEWEEKDLLTHIQKIPLFRVDCDVIKNFMMHHIHVDSSFVSKIAHKTVAFDDEDIYAAFLMSDSKNTLAVLLNEEGEVIALSKTLVFDDNHINEFMYTLRETSIPYEIGMIRKKKKVLRQEEKLKQLIRVELQTLMDEKNQEKLKYLYYEWTGCDCDSMEEMYQGMMQELSKPMDDKMLQLSYFIRLSYHQV